MVIEKYLELNGKKVHYFEDDIPNPVMDIIFLHGKSFKAQTWVDLKPWEYLNREKIKGIYVDIPGWGNSEQNDIYDVNSTDYSGMSKFINDFSESLGLKKFNLLGASFSVPFVLRFALDRPEKVQKLILVGGVYAKGIEDKLEEIRIPSLIIYGGNDTVVGLEPAENYSKILPLNKKVIVKGARHPLYLDKPKEFFEHLIEFLKER